MPQKYRVTILNIQLCLTNGYSISVLNRRQQCQTSTKTVTVNCEQERTISEFDLCIQKDKLREAAKKE